jgi:antitoxin Phd
MRPWQLQEAKNKLSEVIEDALTEGPQLITRRWSALAWI